jgi:DNA-binding MarR family transcriptional regulator
MAQPPNAAHGPNNFKELFSFRLNVLTQRMSQLAALVNQEAFDLDPREWRILGLLGTSAPLTLQALANEVAVDKSQASRIMTGLIERGLLQRNANEEDGRSIHLSLTAQGKQLYRKVFPKAVQRNEALLSVLNAKERQVFEAAMEKLSGQAVDMLTAAHRTSTSKKIRKKTQARPQQGNPHD